jgi:trk system potassium uptake protein TrkA
MAKRAFAVIGLGRFGSAMASTLAELGQDVIGIDGDAERVQKMAGVIQQAIQLDATDERALRDAGVQDVDVAVVSIGENLEASLLAVVQVMSLGVPEVIAKAVTPIHGKILHKLGVGRVVYPEREMAIRVAHALVVPNVLDYFEVSKDFSIVELPAPEDWAGRALAELDLRGRMGLTVIAIRRKMGTEGETTTVSPGAEERIEPGDVLALLGGNDRVAQLDRLRRR